MSYLDGTRIHFSGRFQADTATVNNDVRHFDSSKFQTRYQEPQTQRAMNGWWNPDGTGAFRLLECTVTGAVVDGATQPASDPVYGMVIGGSDDRVSGKIVDLDPQQQGASQLWGLAVRLLTQDGAAVLDSRFDVAPFSHLWKRQQGPSGGDQVMAAYWQSALTDLDIVSDGGSPTLAAMIERADGLLSIKFNVFGCNMTATNPDFTIGYVTGTIGPATPAEPRRFVIGRQLIAPPATTPQGPNPFAAPNGVYSFPCVVDENVGTVTADFGNALPISDGSGTMLPIGDLHLGVLLSGTVTEGESIGADRFGDLGAVGYQDDGWYQRTSGVQSFDLSANQEAATAIGDHPIVVAKLDGDDYEVLVQESIGGGYVRADDFVYRLNPGESATVDLYASRWGRPIQASIALSSTNGLMGGGGGPTKLDPPVPIPTIGTPSGVLSFGTSPVDTDRSGRARITIEADAAGPGTPRYVDGQLYGVGYQLADQPADYRVDFFNFVSVLVWSRHEVPAAPAWSDIEPIMKQYGNLYPIMSRYLFPLDDYDAVVRNADVLRLAFSLPASDPNHMPVTRDLSGGKRAAILAFLADPRGGEPPPEPAAELQVAGRTLRVPGPAARAWRWVAGLPAVRRLTARFRAPDDAPARDVTAGDAGPDTADTTDAPDTTELGAEPVGGKSNFIEQYLARQREEA